MYTGMQWIEMKTVETKQVKPSLGKVDDEENREGKKLKRTQEKERNERVGVYQTYTATVRGGK
jgi:hypothetical protein